MLRSIWILHCMRLSSLVSPSVLLVPSLVSVVDWPAPLQFPASREGKAPRCASLPTAFSLARVSVSLLVCSTRTISRPSRGDVATWLLLLLLPYIASLRDNIPPTTGDATVFANAVGICVDHHLFVIYRLRPVVLQHPARNGQWRSWPICGN